MVPDEEYVKHPHRCAYCGRVYQWSTDDLAWAYEASIHMPCGHPWLYRRDMEDDLRLFQVTTDRANDPDEHEVTCYSLGEMRTAYPHIYPLVKLSSFVSMQFKDEPTATTIKVSLFSPDDDEETSTSPFSEEPEV